MNRNDPKILAEKIRTQYTGPKHTQLDELKQLDRNVKTPANVFAWVFGAVSAVILGAGMSLVMTDLGAQLGMSETMLPGVIVGLVGLVLAIVNYPLYQRILASRKRKYADRVLALSEELMNS